jgi:hypothetical protein
MDMQLSFVDVWLFLMLNHLTAIHVGPTPNQSMVETQKHQNGKISALQINIMNRTGINQP